MKINLLAAALVCFTATAAIADQYDGAFLDKPYKRPVQEVKARERMLQSKAQSLSRGSVRPFDVTKNLKSDTTALIKLQTPVKAQANRGTCSIFSATALLESMLVITERMKTDELDLSEEWLEYLIMRNRTEDGSNSYTNISTLLTQSTTTEELLPYIGETWETVQQSTLAEIRCGKLNGTKQKSCLLGHRNPDLLTASDRELSDEQSDLYDPEFLEARKFAKQFSRNLTGFNRNGQVFVTLNEAKELLQKGIPLTLDFDFYYGAWNHRKATELGMTRNLQNWSLGLVGFPEVGSLDRRNSPKSPAGHSVLVVGYDDTVEVTIPVEMTNGRTENVTYRGVFYFKNSWGTPSFGSNFELDGQRYPGYGAMVSKYAEEFGTFYQLPTR